MTPRRTLAALLAPLALIGAEAAAQQDSAQSPARTVAELQAAEAAAARRDEARARRFRTGDDILGPDGMLAAADLGDGVRIGVGRFTVPEPARPRTWMEREEDPIDLRPDSRGIAAFGLRVPF